MSSTATDFFCSTMVFLFNNSQIRSLNLEPLHLQCLLFSPKPLLVTLGDPTLKFLLIFWAFTLTDNPS
ncbi:hypothetical protein Scep_015320 [Stephania cephalantha]|uniref:Uncharacterized protein n=1 Tax=Stephania cephalantha TaxID=152367 RepID=A0AAP0P1C7_9MAGN